MSADKIKLTLLLLIVALPIGLATWMFNVLEIEGVGSTTNNGVLISPVLDITALDIRDAGGAARFRAFEEIVADVAPEDYRPRPWALILLGGAECGAGCEQRLYYLRQMHRLLDADASRLERWYVSVGSGEARLAGPTRRMLDDNFPDMQTGFSREQRLMEALSGVVPQGAEPVADHYIFVADPVGNVMMYFTPRNTAEQILEDIETLLEQSSLG